MNRNIVVLDYELLFDQAAILLIRNCPSDFHSNLDYYRKKIIQLNILSSFVACDNMHMMVYLNYAYIVF
jgi:hypothetical protein